MTRIIRTLVVDDSAFVRKVVREILSRSPYIEVVGAARDGEEALELVAELNPHVVICDLQMPRLDGIGFVKQQMALRPLPILILTASPQDASLVIEALTAGAVDIVQKPTALANDQLLGIRDELVDKVKALARTQVAAPVIELPITELTQSAAGSEKVDVVVVGISTGGPQALRHLLPQFPANLSVPLAIVLHMPIGYTAPFAEKLNELSAIEVSEAKEGDILRPGVALLAPAGRHLELRRSPRGELVAHLTLHPLNRSHRPSVDVLFQSAANAMGSRVLGVVMTGMGDDGKQGAAWIKAQGGTVLTEHEKSCVIYGMPRAVAEAGLSDGAYPLQEISKAILDRI